MSKRPMNLKLKKKLIIGIGVGAFALLLIIFFFFINLDKNTDKTSDVTTVDTPTLTIETPQKISKSGRKEFTLDVTISSLGDVVYPAASMSIDFDSYRLEFLGVEEGNVFVTNIGDVTQNFPEWNCNPDVCNNSGKINVMYLDTTGGKNAFSGELLAEDGNVVLRLKFRLRESVCIGDVCDLIFDDAVFAASDENDSLATTTDTLNVKNSKIVIGE